MRLRIYSICNAYLIPLRDFVVPDRESLIQMFLHYSSQGYFCTVEQVP